MSRVVVLVAVVAFAGCTRSVEQDDQPPGPDAPPGPGCTATSPRSTTLETFVGPIGLQDRIDAFIDGATKSLDLAMYLFTVEEIMDRIIAAKQRGVAVRVLFDPDHAGNANARARFTSAGVTNRNAPSLFSFSHAKYMIADGSRALIMSANFNVDAMRNERNYGLIDRDADDIADLQAIFNQDWASGGGEPAMPADLSCTRLIVSPSNSMARIIDLIASANTSLVVEALYVSETGVRDAIAAAKQRGAEVRVILDPSSDNADTKAFFGARGIAVRDANGFFNHAKLIIADGIAFVGSENFSLTALTRNREIGALVTEPAAVAPIAAQFEADWQ